MLFSISLPPVLHHSKRNFLHLVGAGIALGMVRGVATAGGQLPVEPQRKLARPKALKRGDTVGIVCPASSVTTNEIKSFVEVCKAYGLSIRFGKNVSKRRGYLSASDADRASEFMAFVNDPSIDAIVCGRGGYGVMRILPMLDYEAIRNAGKVIVGFSDITALLIAVENLSQLTCFHGPVASSTFDQFTVQRLDEVVMERGGGKDEPSLFSYSDARLTTLQKGVATGRLTGGNLAMIVATLGTRFEINTSNAILFLEEIHEEPYKVDRMLTQLWLSGKLDQCSAIVLGNFRDCEAKATSSIQGVSFSLMEVFEQRLVSLGIPILSGLPFGHVRSKLTLPLGTDAEVDATNKRLRLLEPAVRAVA
jgi:muramoyltetrapeptide carboxypeptidase